jgi:hypothetical protein
LKQPLALAFTFLLATLAFTATATLPASAGAEATIGPPPTFSTAPGLPDNRVYEQVSPTDKNGNNAGANTNVSLGYGTAHYALAAADGNGVLFEGSGAMGETAAGYNLFFEASKNVNGRECPDSGGSPGSRWCTRAIMPRALTQTSTLGAQPEYVDPSADLSHVIFESGIGAYATPHAQCGYEHRGGDEFYLSGPDPFVAPTWLARPEISNPIEVCTIEGESGYPVGGTPDFSTVYFTYPGTLLPEDASRAPYQTITESYYEAREPWGFYEYSGGVLSEAGVLPDGSLDPFGAAPAASGHERAITGNQLADEGKRAFFVSPDPASCTYNGGQNNCTVDPPQLYVRENGEKTVLVSRDTLLPPVDGLPAPAPDGALGFTGSTHTRQYRLNTSFVYASPDGSQAFFESEDALTKAAEVASPGAEPKMYDFNVNTGSLTYLPGVVGQIVTSDQEGSSFAFVSPEAAAENAELDLWSAGPAAGGTVTPITQLTGKAVREYGGGKGGVDVPVARMSSDGSAVVFLSSSLVGLSGDFNSGTNLEQVYRYDVPTNTLGCVSCAPAGVTPESSAELSVLQANESAERGVVDLSGETGLVDERGISSNGDRIFFDTADPLVPQVTNTGSTTVGLNGQVLQGRNVYEWENGTVYLLSSGKSTRSSYFLDNSENGSDVFFATTDGLVPGDTDGAYDVYDARIPHPGDNPPPAVPCEGSVCQGPPNVPSPLTPPSSATFSGLGNPTPEVTPPPPPAKTTTKPVKCKKSDTKNKKGKCVPKKKKKAKAKKSAHTDRRAK